MSVNEILESLQNAVPVQPWGYRGTNPVPVEIKYDASKSHPWQIRWVSHLRGSKRAFSVASGRTILDAAQEGLLVQRVIDS